MYTVGVEQVHAAENHQGRGLGLCRVRLRVAVQGRGEAGALFRLQVSVLGQGASEAESGQAQGKAEEVNPSTACRAFERASKNPVAEGGASC